MEITLDTIDGLPEGLRPLAAEADGKFKLDLTKVAPASELETARAKGLQAQNEAIDRRKALKAWEALGGTPEEVQAKLAKGADPEIINQMRTQHATELSARDAKLQSVVSKYTMAELKAELAQAGVVPEGLDILATFAAPRIKHDEDGNAIVMMPDGKPMVGSGANGGATLKDLAKELAKSIPHLVADGGKGGGGKPPSDGGTPQKTITRAQFDAMPHHERASFSKSGGKVVD